MSEKILSKEDLINILQEKLQTSDFKLKNSEWFPFSEDAEGFMGQHYILKLTYKMSGITDSETFFVKRKPQVTLQNHVATELKVYEREIFFYKNLLGEFKKYGYKINFAPKFYYCKNEEILVLEDLQQKNYEHKQIKTYFDEEELRAALRSLAYLHANSISLEEKKSKELNKAYNLFEENEDLLKERLFVEGTIGYEFFKTSVACMLTIVNLMPQSKEWKKIFVDKITAFNASVYIGKEFPFRKTLTHTDLWTNNMLFNYTKDEPHHCCLVDFQILRYYYSAFDVLLLLHLHSSRKFRKEHLTSLMSYYYSTFSDILKENECSAVDLLPEEEFLKSVKAVRPLAVFTAACYRTFKYIPREIMNSASKSSAELEDVFFKDDFRVKHIEGIYKNDEAARNVILDDIYDIFDNL